MRAVAALGDSADSNVVMVHAESDDDGDSHKSPPPDDDDDDPDTRRGKDPGQSQNPNFNIFSNELDILISYIDTENCDVCILCYIHFTRAILLCVILMTEMHMCTSFWCPL